MRRALWSWRLRLTRTRSVHHRQRVGRASVGGRLRWLWFLRWLLRPAVAVVVVPALGLGVWAGVSLAAPVGQAALPSAQPLGPPPGEPAVPQPHTVLTVGQASGRAVVTGLEGRTVYVFSADGPGSSKCIGGCAAVWLPVRSYGGKPGGSGAFANSVGSIVRLDGSDQVTLNRLPLYYYSRDQTPGQATGSGRSQFGGVWQPASATGKP